MKQKILFAWSGGKDSALALRRICEADEYEVVAVLSVVNKQSARVPMHRVPAKLVAKQAEALGYQLETISVDGSKQDGYELRMGRLLKRYKMLGVEAVGFGDVFLQEVRFRREEKLKGAGMEGVFPLWGCDTRQLAKEFIEAGFKAIVTCVNTKAVDKDFAGRTFGRRFLADLPTGVDSCGENGEFHCFVYDGPGFAEPIRFEKCEIVVEEDFSYCGLQPVASIDSLPNERCRREEIPHLVAGWKGAAG